MTEEEAKTKWCPHNREEPRFVRHVSEIHPHAPNRCIGSACMAWRNELGVKSYPDGSIDVQLKPTGHGYCGLAGKP